MAQLTPREEISATHRWIIGLVLTIIIQSSAVFFWAATLQAQVNSNTDDVAELRTDLNTVNTDIRAILIGIEQLKSGNELLKARLGIVEDK